MDELSDSESKPAGFRRIILATLPVLLFGLVWSSLSFDHVEVFGGTLGVLFVPLMLLAVGVTFAGFGVGWSRGFPSWSLPYVGAAIFFSWFLGNSTTPFMRPFGYPMFGRELWGWRGWMPFLVLSSFLYLRYYSRVDWRLVQRRFREDWTLVLFAGYGASHFLLGLILDEVASPLAAPAGLLGTGILVAGVVIYLWTLSRVYRVLALAACPLVAALSLGLFSAMYWDGRQESWMKTPANGWETFLNISLYTAVLMTICTGGAWIVARLVGSVRLDNEETSKA